MEVKSEESSSEVKRLERQAQWHMGFPCLYNRMEPGLGNWSGKALVFLEGKKRIETVMGNASLCRWHFNFINRNFNILSIPKPSTILKAHNGSKPWFCL